MAKRFNPLAIFIVLVGIIVLATALKEGYLGIPELGTGLGDSLWGVLPGLFVTIFGLIIVLAPSDNPATSAGFGAVGIGFALLLAEMINVSIITVATIAPWSLTQLQSISIIGGILFGGILYASRRR